jgi:uncharacterized protein
MFGVIRILVCLLIVQILAMPNTDSSAQTAQTSKQYLYVLHLTPKLHDPTAWTERENALVAKHFERLQEATRRGVVILAGRTEEPLDKTFGIVVFEAPSDEDAKAFMQTDPTVAGGVMTAVLHPYSVALLRK